MTRARPLFKPKPPELLVASDLLCCTDLPFQIDELALWDRLGLADHPGEADEVRRILDQATGVAHPKGLVRRCRVTGRDGGGRVTVEDEMFTSRLLVRQLEVGETVYSFVLTAGEELEALQPPEEDLLARMWWNEVKTAVMRASHKAFQREMARRFDTPEPLPFLSPGSGDIGLWSVDDQRPLFHLLGDVEKQIGVRLNRACCMVPRHTISGIHYVRNGEFVTCKVCRQSRCPDRLAPFDHDLWVQLKNPC